MTKIEHQAPDHEKETKPDLTRRLFLSSTLASLVVSSLGLMAVQAKADPLIAERRNSQAGTALDTLRALARASDVAAIQQKIPLMLMTPILYPSAPTQPQALQSLNAGIDVLEELIQAGIVTLGPEFLNRLVASEATLGAVGVANAPDGAPIRRLVDTLGLPDSEIQSALTYVPTFQTLDGMPLPGLQNMRTDRLDRLRAQAATFLASDPEICALIVAGAALSGSAVVGLANNISTENTWLGSAFIGFALAGMGSDLLPFAEPSEARK
jgi:hypothetical protein